MALEGTLKDFALPDIFQLIGLQKKTGALILTNESDEVTIAFKDGLLVSADSRKKRLEERLGTRLVKSGLITEGQLHDVLEKQKQTLQRIGIVLVNEGLVRKEDLRKALEIQVTQIIFRVFRWEDADYRFDQDAQIDYDRENFQPIGAESILMEGMRILDEWPIVEKVVRSLQGVYEKVPVNQPIVIEGARKKHDDEDDDFDFDLSKAPAKKGPEGDAIKLTADEGAVYQLLDGTRTVEDIMYLARLSDFDAAKAIYDLLNRDLIRERTAGGASGSTATIRAMPSESSPAMVALVTLVVIALVVAGVLFFRLNPLNAAYPFGVAHDDLRRQEQAAIGSRLDRTVHALEAYRLASGDRSYPHDLDELVDLGYLRSVDIQNPWGVAFDYTLTEAGLGFTLQAVDADEKPDTELERTRGDETAAPPT